MNQVDTKQIDTQQIDTHGAAPRSEPTTAKRAPHLALAPEPPATIEPAPAPTRVRATLVAADAMSLMIGFALAFAVQYLIHPVPGRVMLAHALLALLSVPAFALGAVASQLYLSRANERPSEELHNITRTVGFGIMSLLLISFIAKYEDLSRLWVVLAATAIVTTLTVERMLARRMFARLRHDGRLRRPIVIVGTDTHAISLMHTYRRNPHLGYDVVGFVGPDPLASRSDVPVLGDASDVSRLVRNAGAVGAVISLHSIDAEDVNSLTRDLTEAGCHVALSSALCDIDISRLRPQEVGGNTLIYVEQIVRSGWRAGAKRAFDMALATTLLVLSAPVLAIAAVAIKATSPGPVLFRQTRIGKDGVPFEILKLRTMTADAEERKAELLSANEADGPLFKMASDPRVTTVGRWLRKLSIDELPQLACVLRGTMSMVGPRPALPDEVAQWDPEVRKRLRVLPGITGLWQVSGRSDSTFEQYTRLDLYYVDNWRLGRDLAICARTVRVVLTGRGAS
jgi:exopolysaccharide biosynthesis polyprenyl glycosylphosphotransferase